MLKKTAIVAAICGMSACSQYAEITTAPQPVAFSSAATQQASTALTDTTMRTFAAGEKEGSRGDELLGASCNLQGSGFNAQFVTPAIVQLPQFKGAADPVNVNCRANGQTGSVVREPINLTVQRMNQSSGQTSIIGILVEAAVQTAITAARNPLNDDYGYGTGIGVIIPGTVQ